MITNAEFITSVANVEQMKSYPKEIAIAGKSNVGKSSFINFICKNKNLARTSKDPGRTRLLNYFNINKNQFVLVDLPGYGYAKVSGEEQAKWVDLIEYYLKNSTGIKNVFLLVDIRHDPTEDDMQMIKYLYYYRIPFTIIATKSDKISRNAVQIRRKELANYIGVGEDNILISSALDKTGAEQIYKKIDEIISM